MSDQYVGEIRMFAGNYAPEGWLLCNGQRVQISGNESLFSLLGTTYGGNGTTNFGVPDLQGRVVIGQGQGPGLTNRPLGATVGTETVELTSGTMPAHSHMVFATSSLGTSASPTSNIWATSTVKQYSTATPGTDLMSSQALASAGGTGAAHSNMMPFLTINFIIAAIGLYPDRQP